MSAPPKTFRQRAYELVELELDALAVLAVSTPATDEWTLTVQDDSEHGSKDWGPYGTLLEAVDAVRAAARAEPVR